MSSGCRGALWGLVVGLVVSALIVLVLMSDRPSHPVVATPWTVPVSATVDNEASAYASLQAYMLDVLPTPKGEGFCFNGDAPEWVLLPLHMSRRPYSEHG